MNQRCPWLNSSLSLDSFASLVRFIESQSTKMLPIQNVDINKIVIIGTKTKYGNPILLNLLSMKLITPLLFIIISAKKPLIIMKRGILNPCINNTKIPYPSFSS